MNNLVHKHAHKFNRASVQKDKKKEFKKGVDKHKSMPYNSITYSMSV